MATCTICGKISGTGEDHLDCTEKRRVEMEDEESQKGVLGMAGATGKDAELAREIKAVIDHMMDDK